MCCIEEIASNEDTLLEELLLTHSESLSVFSRSLFSLRTNCTRNICKCHLRTYVDQFSGSVVTYVYLYVCTSINVVFCVYSLFYIFQFIVYTLQDTRDIKV